MQSADVVTLHVFHV